MSSSTTVSTSSSLTSTENNSTKIIYALVGLPARGKSYLSAKIVGYFNWLGISSKTFNAGRKRRVQEGASVSGRADFFVNNNTTAVSKRDQIALETLQDALDWLQNDNGIIAVFDATNTTKERRKLILNYIEQHATTSNSEMKDSIGNRSRLTYQLVFIESICNDQNVLENNLIQKVLHSPDFQNMELADALNDLKKRIQSYEEVYETVDDSEGLSYIKVIDLANKMICFRVWDSIPLRTVQLLMSCHIGTRPVYLVRSGQCEDVDDLTALSPIYNSPLSNFVDDSGSPYADTVPSKPFSTTTGTTATPASLPSPSSLPTSSSAITTSFPAFDTTTASFPPHLPLQSTRMRSAVTCNAVLNSMGKSFSEVLGSFICNELSALNPSPSSSSSSSSSSSPLHVITSTLPRAIETASSLPCPLHLMQQRSALGILDTGIYHGMRVEAIQATYPEEYQKWKLNPFIYRFAGGESLLDMNRRLADIVLEIERYREPVVIVSHLSPIQSLIAYFTNRDPKEIPLISVPQHTVVKLVPSIYGWSVTIIPLQETRQNKKSEGQIEGEGQSQSGERVDQGV